MPQTSANPRSLDSSRSDASSVHPRHVETGLLCPRCDYDVTGLQPDQLQFSEGSNPELTGSPRTSSAQTHADLDLGRCPECGVQFSWRNLLLRLPAPAWSLEPSLHLSVWNWPGRSLRVLRRTLTPASLWNTPEPSPASRAHASLAPAGLMLAHPVRAAGLLYSMACSFVASWLVSVAVLAVLGGLSYALVMLRHHAHASYQEAVAVSNPVGAMRVFPRATIFQFITENRVNLLIPGAPWTRASADTQRIAIMTVWVLGVAAAMPVAFLLLAQTMNRHRVQRRHLWRVASYSFVPLPVLAVALSMVTWSLSIIEGVRIWLTNAAGAASLGVPGYGWADRERGWLPVRAISDSQMFNLQQWVAREGSALAALLALGFVWLFWFRASSRYLRLPGPALDTLVLLVVSVLLAPAVGYAIFLGSRAFTGVFS